MENLENMENAVKKELKPVSTYMLIWLGLMMLTAVTVVFSILQLGQFSVVAAITIATVKAGLVIWYFMHIKYEDVAFKVMLALAVVTLTAILLITFLDVSFR